MKAGPGEVIYSSTVSASVSPLNVSSNEDDGVEVEEDEEGLEEFEGEALERIRPEREGRFLRKLLDPKLPSAEEVATHCLTGHVNYRSWCEVCVRACGKEWDHKRREDQDRKFPEYAFDYCFPGDELGYK